MGITVVVLSLAVVVHIKGSSLKAINQDYEIRLENLTEQKAKEEQRALDLEAEREHVQSKGYIKEVAKEKLGLVDPDEILLKPSNAD